MKQFLNCKLVVLLLSVVFSTCAWALSTKSIKEIVRSKAYIEERMAFIKSRVLSSKGHITDEAAKEIFDLEKYIEKQTKKYGAAKAEKYFFQEGDSKIAALDLDGNGGTLHSLFFNYGRDGQVARFSNSIPKTAHVPHDASISVHHSLKSGVIGEEVHLRRLFEMKKPGRVQENLDELAVVRVKGQFFNGRIASQIRTGPKDSVDGKIVAVERNLDNAGLNYTDEAVDYQVDAISVRRWLHKNSSSTKTSLATGKIDTSQLKGTVIDSSINSTGTRVKLITSEAMEYTFKIKAKPKVEGKADELEITQWSKGPVAGGVESLLASGHVIPGRQAIKKSQRIDTDSHGHVK